MIFISLTNLKRKERDKIEIFLTLQKAVEARECSAGEICATKFSKTSTTKHKLCFSRKRQYFMHIEPVLELLLPWEHTNRIKKINASRIRYILSQSILCWIWSVAIFRSISNLAMPRNKMELNTTEVLFGSTKRSSAMTPKNRFGLSQKSINVDPKRNTKHCLLTL